MFSGAHKHIAAWEGCYSCVVYTLNQFVYRKPHVWLFLWFIFVPFAQWDNFPRVHCTLSFRDEIGKLQHRDKTHSDVWRVFRNPSWQVNDFKDREWHYASPSSPCPVKRQTQPQAHAAVHREDSSRDSVPFKGGDSTWLRWELIVDWICRRAENSRLRPFVWARKLQSHFIWGKKWHLEE